MFQYKRIYKGRKVQHDGDATLFEITRNGEVVTYTATIKYALIMIDSGEI